MRDEYKRLFRRHIGREPTQGDGYSDEELTFHEHRLELRLPEAMRTYYRSVGRNEQFNRSHNELVAPQDLERDGEIVVFMSRARRSCAGVFGLGIWCWRTRRCGSWRRVILLRRTRKGYRSRALS